MPLPPVPGNLLQLVAFVGNRIESPKRGATSTRTAQVYASLPHLQNPYLSLVLMDCLRSLSGFIPLNMEFGEGVWHDRQSHCYPLSPEKSSYPSEDKRIIRIGDPPLGCQCMCLSVLVFSKKICSLTRQRQVFAKRRDGKNQHAGNGCVPVSQDPSSLPWLVVGVWYGLNMALVKNPCQKAEEPEKYSKAQTNPRLISGNQYIRAPCFTAGRAQCFNHWPRGRCVRGFVCQRVLGF